MKHSTTLAWAPMSLSASSLILSWCRDRRILGAQTMARLRDVIPVKEDSWERWCRWDIRWESVLQHNMGLSCAKLSRTTVILVHIDLVIKLRPMADLKSSLCLWFSSSKVCFSLKFVFHQRLSSLEHYVNFQSRSSIESCLPPKLIFHQILSFNHSFHSRLEIAFTGMSLESVR